MFSENARRACPHSYPAGVLPISAPRIARKHNKRVGVGHIAWNRRYSVISHLRSSLWIVPICALFTQLIVKRLAERLGGWMVSRGYYDLKTGFYALDHTEAHAALDRIFTLNLSC